MEDNKELEQEVQNENTVPESMPTIDETIQSEVGNDAVISEVEAPVSSLEENTIDEAVKPTVGSDNGDKKSKTPIIATVCAVILIALGAFLAYTKMFNAKSIFTKSIDKRYNKLEKWLDDNWDSKEVGKTAIVKEDLKVKISANESLLKDQSTKALIDELNKLELKSEIGVDSKNNNLKMNFNALYDNSDLINIGTYLYNKRYYVELKGLYDKYIDITDSIKTEGNNINIEKEDVKYILSTVKNSFNKNLNSKDFKKSKETVVIDGKKVKTTKITYNFTQKTIDELSYKMVEDLAADSKFVKIIAKISNVKESEIKANLKEAAKEIKEATKSADTKDVMSLSCYVKGFTNDFVGLSLNIKGSSSGTLSFFENKGVEQFIFDANNSSIVAIEKDDKLTVELKKSDKVVGTLEVNKEEKGKTTSYNYSLNVQGTKLVSGSIEYEEKSKEQAKLTITGDVMGMASITISDNISVKYVDKIDMPSFTNAIKAENITEFEKQQIENKLRSSVGMQKLMFRLQMLR